MLRGAEAVPVAHGSKSAEQSTEANYVPCCVGRKMCEDGLAQRTQSRYRAIEPGLSKTVPDLVYFAYFFFFASSSSR